MSVIAAFFLVVYFGVSTFLTPYTRQHIPDAIFYKSKNADKPTTVRSTVVKVEGEELLVRLEEGPRMDDHVRIKYVQSMDPKPGDRVLIHVLPGGELSQYTTSHWRVPGIIGLAFLFVLLVFSISGRRGAASLVGLAISIGVIALGLIPAVLNGANAFWASVVSAFIIATLAIMTAHGWRWRTVVSLASIFTILGLTVLLAMLGEKMGYLTGIYDETSALLQIRDMSIDMRGVLIGGIIIATLGVLDDVVTTQTATIDELYKAQPKLTVRKLIRHGLSVGNEHVVALVNTLALAYVGVSLPIILSIVVNMNYNNSLLFLFNSEFIAQEIIRTLVSGMALVAAVPLSTVVAAVLIKHQSEIFAKLKIARRKKRRT